MRPGGAGSLVGHVISGRYRIERVVGEGGMGVVYAAEHLHMRKRLAVKILHPEMSRLPEVVERFEREAMAAGHIDHPNVATATDFGKLEDGSFFLVLEYIEGKSLRDVLAQGRLEVSRALHVVEQIAMALARASVIGIVHRDLKPENVMLIDKDGDPDFVKVLDFGIAKVPVAELAASEVKRDPARPVLTQLGMVYGTPEYMAPEQALGQAVDARADLYALGVMSYEMLTGQRPFDHESKVTLLGMHVTAPVPAMAKTAPDAAVSPEVEAIVMRLLAKEASARFADARELLETMSVSLGLPLTGPALSRRSGNASRASLPSANRLSGQSGGYPQTAGLLPSAEAAPSPWRTAVRAISLQLRTVAGRLAKVPTRTWTIVGASGGAVVFFILFVAVLAGGKPSHAVVATDARAAQPPTLDGSGIVKAAVAAAVEQEVAAARQALGRGDAETAIKKLSPLEPVYPGRADIHHALWEAYALQHETKKMIEEARSWLAADAKAASDAELGEAIRGAALSKEDEEAAFGLLEGPMGAPGVDILYEMAYGKSAPSAGARAKAALQTAEVRSHASDAALVALDLHTASSCEGKRAVLPRARESGDARAMPLLTPLTYTQGCGFLRTRDCWSCLHRDGALKDAIAAISARSASP